jgi:signal peptidase I
MTDETKPSDASPDAAPKAKAKGTDWWAEVKAILWLILGVLAIHSFIAKPFYIPSESMMPVLLKGDRLVVSKFPYGWSWVSPSFHVFPRTDGRLFGSMPERGDIVILTPRGASEDWIKRVIGLPGDTVEMVAGQLHINGQPVTRERVAPVRVPIDANAPCDRDLAPRQVVGPDGAAYCELPVYRETLPNGRSYDTIDLGAYSVDDLPKTTVPANHVFLMGDNRDKSADSRVAASEQGLGGSVPWENIGGRAEFITFSLDGSTTFNPLSWFTSFRGGRAGSSLRPAEGPAPGEGATGGGAQ